jgi:hypothetical protein
MNSIWTRDASRLTVRFPVSPIVRLFGLPFLVVGLYFGSTLVFAAAEALRGEATLAETAAGLVLALLIALTFGVPGVLLVFARAGVLVDAAAGRMDEVKQFGPYRYASATPLSSMRAVRVVRRNPASSSATGASYHVELLDVRGRATLVGLYDGCDAAVALGRQVSSLLALPLEQRVDVDSQAARKLAEMADEERRAV